MSRFGRSFYWWSFALVALSVGCGSRMDLSRASTQVNVGVRAARGNLWREALFRFQRAVQLDPSDAMARNNLAVAYEGIGEFEKARVEYLEALRIDKSNQYIQKNYSRFVEFTTRNRKRQRGPEAPRPDTTSRPSTEVQPIVPGAAPADRREPPRDPGTMPPQPGRPVPPPPNGGLV